MTELNKFGIIGLLPFHEKVTILCDGMFLSKTSVCLKGHIFGIRETG